MYLKHDFYRNALAGTRYILCKESAAEYLNMSNGTFGRRVDYYTEAGGREIIKKGGILCTSVNQTINDLLADDGSDEQTLLESLSNYYFDHNESFDGMRIEPENLCRFEELKQAAVEYYDD